MNLRRGAGRRVVRGHPEGQQTTVTKLRLRQPCDVVSRDAAHKKLPATPKGRRSPEVSFLVLLSLSSILPTLTI